MRIDQSTTFVVTGANRENGIGFALVRQALARGAGCVLATYRTAANSRALLDLARADQRLKAEPLDLMDAASAAAFAAACTAQLEHLDVLINNAGLAATRAASILESPIEQWEAQLQVHAVGPLRLTQLLEPLWSKSKQPVIANISSDAGTVRRVGGIHIHYGPAKMAQNALSRQMAANLSGRAIVLAVHPGWVQTDMGGEGALIPPDESAAGILDLIETARPGDSGRFIDYTGQDVDW